jgi:2-hydroxychromene-2-carboxylate isomerase
MPANAVKSERDERLWSKAKAQAAKQGHAEDWDYVMGIYQRMKGRTGGSKEGHVKKLYDVNPPISMRSSLMTHGTFFIPDSNAGLKTAAFLDDCSFSEKAELFKVAVEEGTNDLSDAYVKLKRGMEDEELEVDDDEGEYDTTNEGAFIFPAGSTLENEHKTEDETNE